MKAYSNDLRLKIIETIQANELPQVEIAEQFGVSISFLEKLWHRFRTTGSYGAKAHAGGVERFLKNDEELIRELVVQEPDATLSGLCEKVAARTGKAKVTTATMCVELQRLGLPLKKSRFTPPSAKLNELQQRRVAYAREVVGIDLSKFKFLDEAGSNLAMTRLYGRAAKGERVVDSVPQNYGENITMLAALTVSGIVAPMTINGAVDGAVFKEYIKQILAPVLKAGDCVVMDNLPAHKVKGIKELIEATGAQLIYLPPYSPDLNPIEKCRSKIKTYLRAAKARTGAELEKALVEVLLLVSSKDAIGWFRSCGYAIH